MAGVFQPNIFQRGVFQETGTPVADTSTFYGGVGHYLEAQERARQLARIARKTPAPIMRTTAPVFKAVGRPPIAPSAPVIDLQATQNQRMAAEQQAATIKRRQQEEEFLLLAS